MNHSDAHALLGFLREKHQFEGIQVARFDPETKIAFKKGKSGDSTVWVLMAPNQTIAAMLAGMAWASPWCRSSLGRYKPWHFESATVRLGEWKGAGVVYVKRETIREVDGK